ncbi:MAG: PilZ domain-containing protein, partial [Sedimentisphaerales bacterium]|nr:PilZ domain-containing protein [Sedimentisphaerales bacterium]
YSVTQTLDYLRTQANRLYDASAVQALVDAVETQPIKPTLTVNENIERPLRRFERRYMRLTVQVRSAIGSAGGYRLSPPQRVMMHNLSQSGVGFLSSRSFRINTVLQITLPGTINQPAQTLNAVVVRSQNHGDGWYTHGCRLEKLLTAEQVEYIQNGIGSPA